MFEDQTVNCSVCSTLVWARNISSKRRRECWRCEIKRLKTEVKELKAEVKELKAK